MKKINPKYIALIIVIILLCFLSWCHGRSGVKTETGKPDKPNHDSIYKSEQKDNEIIKSISKELCLLKTKNDSLMNRKPIIIIKVKTKYDSLRIADTSCQNSLIMLYNSFGELNDLNDSIIANNTQRLKKDSVLISTLFRKIETKQNHITIDSSYIVRLCDSIPKVAKAEFKRGKKVGRKQGVIGTVIAGAVLFVGVKAAL